MAGLSTQDLLPLCCLGGRLSCRSRTRGVVSALARQRDGVQLPCFGGTLVEQGWTTPAHWLAGVSLGRSLQGKIGTKPGCGALAITLVVLWYGDRVLGWHAAARMHFIRAGERGRGWFWLQESHQGTRLDNHEECDGGEQSSSPDTSSPLLPPAFPCNAL